MALVRWPDDISIREAVRCIICGSDKSLRNVTTALVTKEDEQLFLCIGHFWNAPQLIVGLCDFVVQQEQQELKQIINRRLSNSHEFAIY